MKMSDYILEYEKLTGKPVKPAVARFAEGLDRICEKAEHMGQADAAEGKAACAADIFQEWSVKVLHNDQYLVDVVTEFLHDAYLNGFNEARSKLGGSGDEARSNGQKGGVESGVAV